MSEISELRVVRDLLVAAARLAAKVIEADRDIAIRSYTNLATGILGVDGRFVVETYDKVLALLAAAIAKGEA